MKSNFVYLLFIFMFTFFFACSDDNNPASPKTDEDLQYVGNWSGTTNKGGSLSFSVKDVGGNARISGIHFQYPIQGGFGFISTTGGTEVNGGQFSYSGNGLNLDGTFTNTIKATGNYSYNSSGNSGSGTFSLSKN